MKVLLVGSNGFVGSNILKVIREENVIFTLNRSNSNYNYNLGYDKIDIKESFDCVIHAAGRAHFTVKSSDDRRSFFQINVEGTIQLLESLSKRGGLKYFIFMSSVSVYGMTEGYLVKEDSPLLASDPYGKSKIDAEYNVISWCKEHDVVCTILRLPLVVGRNAPGNLRAMIQAIKYGFYFNVADGASKKSMVLVSDIANIIIKVSKVGGIFNLTDGYHPSFNELSNCIAAQLGRGSVLSIPYFCAKYLANIGDAIGGKAPLDTLKLSKITSTLTFDDTRARRVFGWSPTSILKGFEL